MQETPFKWHLIAFGEEGTQIYTINNKNTGDLELESLWLTVCKHRGNDDADDGRWRMRPIKQQRPFDPKETNSISPVVVWLASPLNCARLLHIGGELVVAGQLY